jgi:hypothetical protein
MSVIFLERDSCPPLGSTAAPGPSRKNNTRKRRAEPAAVGTLTRTKSLLLAALRV